MTAEELLREIESDRNRGATELALAALQGIRELDESGDAGGGDLDSLLELVSGLQVCRPSMAALENLMGRLHQCLSGHSALERRDIKAAIHSCCDDLMKYARDSQEGAVRNMLGLIEAGDVIMTHSISSTIKRLCQSIRDDKPDVRFIVTESRPGDEGKLLALYLAELGIPATYITESQIDLVMAEASKVIVGADAVLADGSIINKSGTTLMALSARHHNVPFYVCAEAFKLKADSRFQLERMDTRELGFDAPGIELRNVYFERVPPGLISAWVN